MKLSLIITTYNRPDMLKLVLASVAHQQLPEAIKSNHIEVIIADDGSTSETAQLIAQTQTNFPFKLQHVWHADLGFRAAAIRNRAASQASGDYLIYIDGDCLLPPDFFEQHVLLAEPGFCVAGNRVLVSQKYTEEVLASASIKVASLSLITNICNRLRGRINKAVAALRFDSKANWRARQAYNWRRPKSCNLGMWRQDLVSVNGFDESFVGWGHEDADLVVRFLHAGIKIKDGRYAAPVYHLWHPSNDRAHAAENMQRLLARANNPQLIKASCGLSQYLTATPAASE